VAALGQDLGQREQDAGLVIDEQDRRHARASIIAARGVVSTVT
jgi:hypothetical protein